MTTSIEWTDKTWNPVTGCTRVSEGCRHCYIERTPPFRMQGRKLGDPVQLHPDRLDQPLRWTKPSLVFVNSLSDLFHEDVPTEFLEDVWARMCIADHHIYQILTKRPKRMHEWLTTQDWDRVGWIVAKTSPMAGHRALARKRAGFKMLEHVWLGVSVEDQPTADERIPILLQTPAAVRFVSAEPLLGPVDLRRWLQVYEHDGPPCCSDKTGWHRLGENHVLGPAQSMLDWVIAGGESGPGARPCDIAWIRSIVQQCKAAAVPCFTKQLGSYVADRNDAGFEGDEPTSWPMDTDTDDPDNEWHYQGAKIRIRLKDRKGGDPSEWPADLRVREWPR